MLSVRLFCLLCGLGLSFGQWPYRDNQRPYYYGYPKAQQGVVNEDDEIEPFAWRQDLPISGGQGNKDGQFIIIIFWAFLGNYLFVDSN